MGGIVVMKHMKNWLGIMMSIILAASSLQVPVYAANADETVTGTETGSAGAEAADPLADEDIDEENRSDAAGLEETADTEELQICTATWYGKDLEQGLDNLVNSASYLLGGIRIDGYYSLNMREIGKLNHAVGGVTVKIEDDFSKYDKEMVPGATVTLTDEQAALFVRSRMSIGDGSNESRMRRQRVYMEALMDKVRKQMTEDKSFGIDIYNELQDIAVTNIPKNRISAISNLMYKSTGKGIRDIDGEHTMGRLAGDKKDYVQFYADEESMVEIFADLIGIGEGKEY